MQYYIRENEQLTAHFKMGEFFPNKVYIPVINDKNKLNGLCSDEYRNIMRLAGVMENIRSLVNKPIFITSGYRTLQQNAIAGGVRGSRHCAGLACDFFVKKMLIRDVFSLLQSDEVFLREQGVAELIFYPNKGIIHLALTRNEHESKFLVQTKY